MAEVAASVALAEAGAAPAAPAPAGHAGFSFVDGDSADPAAAILDEVLSGADGGGDAAAADAPDEGAAAATPAEGEKPAEQPKPEAEAPAEEPKSEAPETPVESIEAAKLRKGFAKLAEERQKLVELQNQARADKAAASSYADKARKYDEVMAAFEKDPAGFLAAHGGDALVKKTLEGFIAMEKSPAEREVAKLREEQKAYREAEERKQQEQVVTAWRNDIAGKVQAAGEKFDVVNTLGLHGQVIDVITGYYEKHSERDDKGNVVRPAILPWDAAAQAVEDAWAAKLDTSKRYGKRAPAAETPAEKPATKDAPPAKKPTPGPAKKPPTSLSSVPVAETPATSDDLPLDPSEREARLLAEMGL